MTKTTTKIPMTKMMTSSEKKMPKRTKKFTLKMVFALAIFCAAIGAACSPAEKGANENIKKTEAASSDENADDFQERLRSLQTGNFQFVFVFRRPDGEVFSSEDKKFLKDNAPRDTNQWVLTRDGKTAIAGSNYKFTPENLTALKKRFIVEDVSPVKTDVENSSNQTR